MFKINNFSKQIKKKSYNKQSISPKVLLTSNSKSALLEYLGFLKLLFKKWEIEYVVISLPTEKKKITLLKSPHVYKKAKEHFELENYKIQILFNSYQELFNIKLLFLNLPSSIKANIKFFTSINNNNF